MESKQNTKLEQAKEVVRLLMDEDYSIEEALKKVKKQNQIDITEHLRLANYIVTQLYRYDFLKERYEFEDLLQLGYLGLVRAAKTFNEDKKIKFSTWAYPKIKYEILQYATRDRNFNLKQGEPHSYKIYSLNYEFDGNDGKPEKFEDILMTDNSFEDDEINKIIVQDLLNGLDKKESEIVRLYYFEEMKQWEIAEIYNTSQVQISRTLREAINKFKKATKNPDQSILSRTRNLSEISC